jgi:hypothetical protein
MRNFAARLSETYSTFDARKSSRSPFKEAFNDSSPMAGTFRHTRNLMVNQDDSRMSDDSNVFRIRELESLKL